MSSNPVPTPVPEEPAESSSSQPAEASEKKPRFVIKIAHTIPC
jgi:hypothetical protein